MRSLADILASNPLVLAPMAGVTEAPFRVICKRYGAGLTFTEMVSAAGLRHHPDSPTARKLLAILPDEAPAAVQLFGSDPFHMAEQAARIVERQGDDVALVDINMGCPVAKVVSKGEGCALMREPARAREVVRAVVSAVSPLPVTVKFRKGFAEGEDTAVGFALAMEEAGASGLAVHGRTRSQFYRGMADWRAITRVKAAVSVPVMGSGDVLSPTAAKRMLDETGCDGVMIARGAQGNPWIFAEARALIERGEILDPPTPAERIAIAREHAAALIGFAGNHAVARMRKHVAWYVHGMPGASRVRERVNTVRTPAELDGLLAEYAAYLTGLGDVSL